ncbi:MAG: UDP-N-acetylmuramate dehydrogenase [Desulfovibrio sp.]|nr:UDP-N-acetylmuramate dehydrogenase [Desulfovibrio sp.]
MHEKLLPNFSRLTTLHLGGRARMLLVAENSEDVTALSGRMQELGLKPLALGNGSNILARDGDHDLALVRLDLPERMEILGREGCETFVRVSAQVKLPHFLRFLCEHALTGLEGLAGIPGTVGGAIAMNAGSFGSEMCRYLRSVTVYTGGSIQVLESSALSYGYRHFAFAGSQDFFLILEAELAFESGTVDAIHRLMNTHFLAKKASQPITLASAGCLFKNPPAGPAAGKLLEEAGFKGRELGGVAFSDLHANFLVNKGNGTASQALELMELAREAVQARSGIRLEPEVRIVP